MRTNASTYKSPESKQSSNFLTPDQNSRVSRRMKSQGPETTDPKKEIMLRRNKAYASSADIRRAIADQKIQDFNKKKYVSKDLTEQDIKDLKEVFDYYDVEKTGMLSPYDLKFLLEDNQFFSTKETLYGTDKINFIIKELFAEMDEEEIGGITFDAFVKMMNPDRTKNEKKDKINRIYRKYDKRNRGFINYEDFSSMVKKENLDQIDDRSLKDLFSRATNNTQKMTFNDFYLLMTNKTYE